MPDNGNQTSQDKTLNNPRRAQLNAPTAKNNAVPWANILGVISFLLIFSHYIHPYYNLFYSKSKA